MCVELGPGGAVYLKRVLPYSVWNSIMDDDEEAISAACILCGESHCRHRDRSLVTFSVHVGSLDDGRS